MPNKRVKVTASPEKLQRIRELEAEKRRLGGIVSRNRDVYAALEFVPNPGPQTYFLGLPDEDEDVLYGGAAGGSKALRCEEPVPTPSGWTTMGALEVGDEVLDEHGQPCPVVDVHPVHEPAGFRLTFDDGTTIDASADHEWLTLDAAELAALTRRTPEFRERRRATRASRATGRRSERFTATITDRNRTANPAPELPAPTGTVRSTTTIAETLRTARGRANHAVPVAAPLTLPATDLPLAPYVLGAWLGDGHSANAGFTSADQEIVDELRAEGVTVTELDRPYAYRLGDRTWTPRRGGRPGPVNSVAAVLRQLGVLGDKHIPAAYLRASAEQRLALLQGLMDTDGTASKTGRVSFTTTSQQLASGVRELIVSLGWKAAIREHRATMRGVDHGPAYTIKWTPDQGVFRLPRKADRQALAQRRTTRYRYIVDAQPIDPTPMRCITVGTESGLFLAGPSMVVTHNSTSLLMHALRSCVRYPGLQAFWFRRTFPELEQSVLRALARFHYAKALGARYDKGQHELRFDNGSILRFAHARNRQDAESLLSAEINALYLDERTTIPPDVVDLLYTRVRSGVAGVPCLGVRSATNPGGVGHLRVLNSFVKATDHGKKATVDEGGRTVRFIQAKATDTPQLDPVTYQKRLAAVPDPELRAAMRDGSWHIFPNQMFGEWRAERHIVPALELPSSWMRYGGLDYGWTAPSVYLLGARDPDGRVWVYRELTMRQVPEPKQAARVLAAEDVRPGIRAADPSMKQRHGVGLAAMSQYAIGGCGLVEANNDRIGGWSRIHTYLAEAPACPYHHGLGFDTCPMLHVVDRPRNEDGSVDWSGINGCPGLVDTLPALPRDKNRPEDVDTTSDDHWADSLRYLLMSIGSAPRLVVWDDDETTPEREPLVPEEQQLQQRGVLAYGSEPGPAFAGLGNRDELDPTVMNGQRSPWA